MNFFLEQLSVCILLAWVGFRITRIFQGPEIALAVGAVIGVFSTLFFRETLPVANFTALFSPIAVTLPLAAVRNVGFHFGKQSKPFSKWELGGFLATYCILVASTGGFIEYDIYRHGYAASGMTAVSLALVLYAILRGHLFFGFSVLLAQILWQLDFGSSNFFDHLGHFLWIPILLTSLLRPTKNKPRQGGAYSG